MDEYEKAVADDLQRVREMAKSLSHHGLATLFTAMAFAYKLSDPVGFSNFALMATQGLGKESKNAKD